jgi:7-carboxy-7-deazaguanine synthase
MITQSDIQIPVMEQFLTLQGEGRFTGHTAYFIRLGGCDVGCVWCDINTLVKNVQSSGSKMVVITGGEPFMHDLTELTKLLGDHKIRTHVETSGAHHISGSWDWITLSPKKFKAPLDGALEMANELKVIIYNKSDFDWAEKYAQQVNENCLLYLQPEWSKSHEMNPLIIEYIKQHPKWILSLQTHKFLDIP